MHAVPLPLISLTLASSTSDRLLSRLKDDAVVRSRYVAVATRVVTLASLPVASHSCLRIILQSATCSRNTGGTDD